MNQHASRIRAVIGVVALTLVAGACGSSAHRAASSPNPIHSTTVPGPPAPCAGVAQTQRQSSVPGPLIMTASAALLRITVDVDGVRAEKPRCVVSHFSQAPLHVHIGDEVTFVANPMYALTPAQAKVVSMSSTPIAESPGIGFGHVTVVLTALAPGSVTLTYTDCSGTGC